MNQQKANDFEKLKAAFPNHDPSILLDTLSNSKDLESAINTILIVNQQIDQQNHQQKKLNDESHANITTRFNSVGFRPQKLPTKSFLDHLFIPGRLMPIESNLNIFGTFSEETLEKKVIQTNSNAKSQDPKLISHSKIAFSTSILPDHMNTARSTPLMEGSYDQFLPWNASIFSSGPSWRCSFSSDNHTD